MPDPLRPGGARDQGRQSLPRLLVPPFPAVESRTRDIGESQFDRSPTGNIEQPQNVEPKLSFVRGLKAQGIIYGYHEGTIALTTKLGKNVNLVMKISRH